MHRTRGCPLSTDTEMQSCMRKGRHQDFNLAKWSVCVKIGTRILILLGGVMYPELHHPTKRLFANLSVLQFCSWLRLKASQIRTETHNPNIQSDQTKVKKKKGK